MNHRWTTEELRILRRGYGRVPNDVLAVLFDVTVQAVRRIAHRYGLTDRKRAGAITRRVKGQLKAARVKRIVDTASRYGLPADLCPRSVQVVMALLDGPMTREQLAERLLCGQFRERGKRVLHHSYTLNLKKRGLVYCTSRYEPTPGGIRRQPGLYLLTPLAMEMLEQGGVNATRN